MGQAAAVVVGDVSASAYVQQALGELRNLHALKKAASDAYSDGVKSVAEQSGFDVWAIKRFVSALENDKRDEYVEQCQQLDLLFEEVSY